METNSQNNSGILKVLVGLLGALILVIGYFTYSFYNDAKDAKGAKVVLQEEKQQVLNDLEELKVNYTEAIAEKSEVSDQLKDAKGRIESLITEVKKQKHINIGVIRKYKKEIAILKAQRDELYKVADSLRAANMNLVVQKDSITNDLNQQKQYNDTLLDTNEKLAQTVSQAKILYPTGLKAVGVKIRSSGKVIETSRYKRAQQVRVCFTVPKNNILEYGPQKFYIRVVNASDDTIGENQVITVGEKEVVISKAEEIVYENQAIDVCSFVKPANKDNEIIKGEYLVEIYHNGQKVGTTNMLLK